MSSSAETDQGSNHNNERASNINKSLSSSSSTSSSPSPPKTHLQIRVRTMEEVWKEIASLHDHPSSNTSHHRDFMIANPSMTPRLRTHQNPNCSFQDFLNRPVNKDPSTSLSMVSTNEYPVPPPATVLSLKSGVGFEFLDSPDPLVRPNSYLKSDHISSHVSSFNSPFEPFVSSSRLGYYGKKRGQDSDSRSSDRRHKRMIKNRESAARSRARKQAYTNELEIEVAHLMEENARLKRQQEQLRLAAASQLPKKHTLQRTSTAPF